MQAVWWPGIPNSITSKVQACGACQEVLPSQPREPLLSDLVLSQSFGDISADLLMHTAMDYLAPTDCLLGWPCIRMMWVWIGYHLSVWTLEEPYKWTKKVKHLMTQVNVADGNDDETWSGLDGSTQHTLPRWPHPRPGAIQPPLLYRCPHPLSYFCSEVGGVWCQAVLAEGGKWKILQLFSTFFTSSLHQCMSVYTGLHRTKLGLWSALGSIVTTVSVCIGDIIASCIPARNQFLQLRLCSRGHPQMLPRPFPWRMDAKVQFTLPARPIHYKSSREHCHTDCLIL